MNKFGAISKILWPEHLCKGKSGFLVGWNLRSFISSIATIVPDMTLEELENELKRMSNDSDMKDIATPIVLGVCISHEDSPDVLKKFTSTIGISQKKQTANLWLTMEYQDNILPLIQSIYCCGYCYQGVSSEIILYKQLNIDEMQYYSLDPLTINFSKQSEIWSKNNTIELDNIDTEKKEYLKKLKKKITIHAQYVGTGQPDDMELLLAQINYSYLIEKKLKNLKKKKDERNEIEQFTSSIRKLQLSIKFFFQQYLFLPIVAIVISTLFILEIILKIFNKFISLISTELESIKNASVTIQQIELRLYQNYNFRWQYKTIHNSPSKIINKKKQIQYLSFYNSITVIVSDTILGIIIGCLFVKYNKQLAFILNQSFWNYTIKYLRLAVDWLMGAPGGLKLNKELDKFLGDLFLWLIQIWSIMLSKVFPYTDEIIYCIGIAGILGASITLSLTSDLLALATLHIHIFYKVASKIYYWQFSILLSLFNLLRGKRRNILRNRLDSFEYNLDQLLLGTIIFTLLFFLYPTTGVYYILFSLSRLTVIAIQIIFDLLLACINQFPIFPLFIRAFHKERLPGGLMFHIVLSEDLLKSGANFKGFNNNFLDSKTTENSDIIKKNIQNYIDTTDIINKDKVFYFLNATESLSSSSSSSIESISSSEEDTSSFKNYVDDSSAKRRVNRLLPINDYNIQNYYNIQNRRYSYDMSYSSPRSIHFNKNKGLNSSQSQNQLNQNTINGNNINIDSQDNSLLSPYSPHINEHIYEERRRTRRFSYQSTNDSFDQKRTIIKNTKCNTFPNLVIDSADNSEEEEEGDVMGTNNSYQSHSQFGKIHSHMTKLLPSPYEPKSLSKRRALTMPDLSFNHLGMSNSSLSSMNRGLIRVNSTTINEHNKKAFHPLSKTTYLIMENTPISYGAIFQQLNNEIITILSQYFSISLIKNLLLGKPISRVHIIQPFILSDDKKISVNNIKKKMSKILHNWIENKSNSREKEKEEKAKKQQ
ncbi:Gpi1-domain-containing protein [Neocallimastix lanati (nom. inval.)]|nr:Gpi1-domain-containing protein [Neocallimastix sp. JGI-2020a]